MNYLNLMGGLVEGGYVEVNTSACRSFRDALAICIQSSRVKRTDANLAVSAGIHPAQFSRIRQGKAHLPTDKIPVIEKLCSNTAITQWLASQHGAFVRHETLQEKVARLEAQLAKVAA